MTTHPLVSAIIPTFNRADLVVRAIESVLAQTYPNIEIIVVDDGSTDDTQEKLTPFKHRIKVLAQPNSGPSIARNRGVDIANGEIIAFLDSDDYWLPTKVSRQVELLNKSDSTVPCCISNGEYSDGTGTTFAIAGICPSDTEGIWVNPAEVLSSRPLIFTQAVAIRRDALNRVGGFSSALPYYCEDHELALRLALEGPWAIIRDSLVVCRRAGGDSLGEKALRELVRLRTDQVEVHKRFLTIVSGYPHHRKLMRRARCEHFRARVQLLIAELQSRGTLRSQVAAFVLRIATRIAMAAYRRSPFYPQVQTRPCI